MRVLDYVQQKPTEANPKRNMSPVCGVGVGGLPTPCHHSPPPVPAAAPGLALGSIPEGLAVSGHLCTGTTQPQRQRQRPESLGRNGHLPTFGQGQPPHGPREQGQSCTVGPEVRVGVGSVVCAGRTRCRRTCGRRSRTGALSAIVLAGGVGGGGARAQERQVGGAAVGAWGRRGRWRGGQRGNMCPGCGGRGMSQDLSPTR